MRTRVMSKGRGGAALVTANKQIGFEENLDTFPMHRDPDVRLTEMVKFLILG